MPTPPPASRSGRTPPWAPALAAALVLLVWAGRASAVDNPIAQAAATSERNAWFRSTLIFLVISSAGVGIFYFGLFRRLLEARKPAWPLHAWRVASYCSWLTACLAALAFKKPLMVTVLRPLLRGNFTGALIDYCVELILLPLIALLGVLVIWNVRRDVTNRSRAT